ncbi:hypothetical protein DFQ28_006074 [Apophysomyces sp. BC1034]|nr:hypothetical protein DFQ30_006052 [Apophysomyces sp. BC1015]KAG0177332.1 hypothetical protein DFQ29_004955 [Apophysomyces sp. BC1021]KAG0187611.1 hypothetical protein DFQ28_006074 [Apophysomyces sp. BC1034]
MLSKKELLETVERDANALAYDERVHLVETILTDLESSVSSPEEENEKTRELQVLKVLGRQVNGSEALFSKRGITVLATVGGLLNPKEVTDTPSSQEALKCLANCILLKETTKVWVDELECIDTCCYILQSPDLSMDTQFLLCRILFFMTVNRHDLVKRLMEIDVAQAIQRISQQHVDVLKSKQPYDSKSPINPVSVVSEALKLLFNLMLVDSRNRSKEEASVSAEQFQGCLVPIFEILFLIPYPEPLPLSPPHSHAIHAMMQYPQAVMVPVWQAQPQLTSLYGSQDEGRELVLDLFIGALDRSVHYLIPNEDPDETASSVPEHHVDAILPPMILVLRNMAEAIPEMNKAMGELLLPREGDRVKPVNKGASLAAYMIRLMTSAMLQQTRNAVCELLYVLCDEDATKFTQQVGYGNAVGFLVNRGISLDPPQESGGAAEDINPITGQYISAEQQEGPSLADMTDEEKEREAERLFVLFERLKKTGIVDVENPIAKAMQEGKFEDKPSDEED